MSLTDQIPTWPEIDMRITRGQTAGAVVVTGMTRNAAGTIATAVITGWPGSADLTDDEVRAGHEHPYRDLPGRLRVKLARELGMPEPRAGRAPQRTHGRQTHGTQ